MNTHSFFAYGTMGFTIGATNALKSTSSLSLITSPLYAAFLMTVYQVELIHLFPYMLGFLAGNIAVEVAAPLVATPCRILFAR